MSLQRAIGNQGVQSLLASARIQARLERGSADDLCEQKAERGAEALGSLRERRLRQQKKERALPRREELQSDCTATGRGLRRSREPEQKEKEPGADHYVRRVGHLWLGVAPEQGLQSTPEGDQSLGRGMSPMTEGEKGPDQETVRTIAAISLAESDPTRRSKQEVDVAWIYYNRWLAQGERGFHASMAYTNENESGLFMIWMVALGDKEYEGVTTADAREIDRLNKRIDAENKRRREGARIRRIANIAEYVRYLGLATRAASVLDEVRAALRDPSRNPYPGWMGQGSRDDINRTTGHWPMVREYIRRRLAGEKLPYVKILPAPAVKDYTIIFNLEEIQAYFGKSRPKNVPLLPDAELVKAAKQEQSPSESTTTPVQRRSIGEPAGTKMSQAR